jgi:oxygen-independent coproporphyrinogen-3 oxidase
MRGLYIHIPFCVKKCRYCDFISYCGKTGDIDRYIGAVENEMREYRGSEIDTVFIGGGTPTVLGNKQLEKLCGAVFKSFRIRSDHEFTIEANPGTIDYEKARTLAGCGVNRVSLGVQSFNDGELRAIGRIHTSSEAYRTVEEVYKAGISNISIDLMSALPNQTMDKLMKTLEKAVTLPVSHISAYSLIIEEGTPMAEDYEKGLIKIPDEDEDRRMYAAAKNYLEKNGFMQYEISNFAKNGFESRHNIKYWECREYFGIGAAAHSYIDGVRFSNTASLEQYMGGEFRSGEKEILTRDDMVFEFIMMGMRMNRGISEKEFEKRFDENIMNRFGELIEKFENGGFLERADGYIRFTDKGRDVSNSVLCEFAT